MTQPSDGIHHEPLFDVATITKLCTEKDGVPVRYICTSELGGLTVDVYYRDTPHPEFGNKYFGVGRLGKHPVIMGADKVEGLEFAMVEGDDGKLHYSSYGHDYKSFKNGNMIDGGRKYYRWSGKIRVFDLKNGEFIERP